MKKPWLSIFIVGAAMSVLIHLLFWAHHLFVTGLNPFLGSVFLVALIVVSVTVPLVISIVLKLRWPVWMLFAAGAVCWLFWSMIYLVFAGRSTLDVHLHDTYYVIAHVHFFIFVTMVMTGLTSIYYWMEKGGYVNGILGRVHFWGTFIPLYILFVPQHYEGLAGMPRRYIDYSGGYRSSQLISLDGFGMYNQTMGWAAMLFLIAQLLFVGMLVYALVRKFFVRADN